MKQYKDQEFCPGHPDGEWLNVRMGKVTASEVGELLTVKTLKVKDGAGPHSYVCGKIAEVYRGIPNPSFGSKATDNGQIYEAEARAAAQLDLDIAPVEMPQVWFCETDDGRAGCSPDGLIESDLDGMGPGGIEIKCPGPVQQVKYLLAGELPEEYFLQVHFSMWVTGRAWWIFRSHGCGATDAARNLPHFTLVVKRDEKVCRAIESAVANFHDRFTAGMNSLQAREL